MIIYTVGFTRTSLRELIGKLKSADVKKVIDVRLQNTSQLAGYAKKDDLDFILELAGIDYEHIPELAPSKDLLRSFKQEEITWEEYESAFLEELSTRDLTKLLDLAKVTGPVCLLCSEEHPLHCHRRLVADHYSKLHPETIVKHL